MAAADRDERAGATTSPTMWVAMAVGGAIVAFGARGLLQNGGRGTSSAVRWIVGSALALDLVIVPALALIGFAARRAVPAAAWPTVRAALIASAALIGFSLPLVLDLGGLTSNPSVRPRDYPTGLAIALGVVWLLALGRLGVRALLARRSPAATA